MTPPESPPEADWQVEPEVAEDMTGAWIALGAILLGYLLLGMAAGYALAKLL